MKPIALAVFLGLCATSMLIVPNTAEAFRGGVHGGGRHFAGGGHWHGGGRHWAGAGGRHWNGGYWRGGRWYGGGWGVGAAALGAAAVGTAAYGASCYQQQSVWNGYQYVTQWVRVC